MAPCSNLLGVRFVLESEVLEGSVEVIRVKVSAPKVGKFSLSCPSAGPSVLPRSGYADVIWETYSIFSM